MARIPEDELHRLKRETDLAALVRASGIELRPHGSPRKGGDLVGHCPFHADRTPSLVITPSKGLWHCLGACGVGGSAIDWVMKVRGVSFRHAVEVLREQVGQQAEPAAASAPAPAPAPADLAPPIVFDAEDRELMVQVVDYYHQRLVGPGGAEARAYLERRGLGGTSGEQAIERFKLGFADRTLGLRLPEKQVKAGRDIRERLQRLGLFRGSGHEHFNGCLVFPVFAPGSGARQVVEMYGRKIGTRLRKGTPLHLYLPGPHAGVWNHEALDAGHDEGPGELPGVIVCESIIDALTFWCAGYRHVIASYGVQGFTDDHLAGLKRWAARGGRKVLIAYDRDEAGERGAEKLAERLLAALPGIECRRVQFPKGMDANEYALKVKPADKSLGLVLRKAEWLGQARAPGSGGAPGIAPTDVGDGGGDDGERAIEAEAAAKEDSAAAPTASPSTSSPSPAPAQATPPSSSSPAPASALASASSSAASAPAPFPSPSTPSPVPAPASSSSAPPAPAPPPPASPSSSASPPATPPEPSCPPADAPAAATPSSLAASADASAAPSSSLAAAPGSAPTSPAALPTAPSPPSPSSSSSPSPRQGADELHEAEGGLVLQLGDPASGGRRYRVRGLEKNLSYDLLKVNLLVSRAPAGERGDGELPGGELPGVHVDTFDLYAARPRQQFIQAAARELEVEEAQIKADLGRLLLKLEAKQEQLIQEATKPRHGREQATDPGALLSESERAEALDLLRDPKLLDRILADFERCGIVGERTNKLVGYLAATSRKLEKPLAVVIQSSSAAGKSSLMEAVLALLPPEEVIKYSAMTGQSLFYMEEADLKHRILAIAEEEGAEQASYALKLLQSEGELTIASTGKDPHTGRHRTEQYRVQGPVMIFLTTTSHEVDEELLNRCVVLAVDEERDQTRAIHAQQRRAETLAGLLAGREKQRLLALHRNAQRLLAPVAVVNPHAEKLQFADRATRSRRDQLKYLTLIRTIALLHQHQRPRKRVELGSGGPAGTSGGGQWMEYIEVTEDDIATADRLCAQVLGRDGEELPPRTRALLAHIRRLVAAECARLGMKASDYRFTRRQVREHSGFGHTQLKVHLRRLEELEYLIPHRAPLPGGGQRIVYKLDPPPPEAPEAESDPFRGRGRGQGRRAGVGRIGTPPDVNGEVGEANARSGGAGRAGRESASAGTDHEVASYPQPPEPPPESEAAALASATSGKERD